MTHAPWIAAYVNRRDVDGLISQVESRSKNPRRDLWNLIGVIRALGEIGDSRAEQALVTANNEVGTNEIRRACESALNQIWINEMTGWPERQGLDGMISLVESYDKRKMQGIEAEAKLTAAIALLGKAGDTRAAPGLLALYRCAGPGSTGLSPFSLADKALRTIWDKEIYELVNKRAVDGLLEIIRTHDFDMAQKYRDATVARFEKAAEALGQIRDGRAVPLLQSLLTHKDHNVAADAAKALGAIGNKEALGFLAASLDERMNQLLESTGNTRTSFERLEGSDWWAKRFIVVRIREAISSLDAALGESLMSPYLPRLEAVALDKSRHGHQRLAVLDVIQAIGPAAWPARKTLRALKGDRTAFSNEEIFFGDYPGDNIRTYVDSYDISEKAHEMLCKPVFSYKNSVRQTVRGWIERMRSWRQGGRGASRKVRLTA